MNLLLDTNIILHITRNDEGIKLLKEINPDEQLIYVSFVNIAETQSIAYQNNWGKLKTSRMESFFNAVRIIDISDMLFIQSKKSSKFSGIPS